MILCKHIIGVKVNNWNTETDKSSDHLQQFHIVPSSNHIPPLIVYNTHMTSVKHTRLDVIDYLITDVGLCLKHNSEEYHGKRFDSLN